MARIQETVTETMNIAQLNDPIIFVVDMINGFIKEGALHDAAIMDCVKPIQQLIEDADCRRIFVADAHPPKTREFISYPAHCVIGTSESEIIDELKPYVEEVFHKNSTNAFTCADMETFLKTDIDRYHDIVICGCCSDICIMQFALCLNAWLNEHNRDTMRIIIPTNTIDTYHIEGIHDAQSENAFAIRNMRANGITIVNEIVR